MMVLAMAMFASHKRVSASVVNMRAEGSKNAQIVAKLSKGDVVEILQAGNWDYVDFQGQTGYIKSNLLTPLSDEEEAMMAPPPSEEVVPDDDSSSFFSSLVESPFTRHDWKWPIWVVIIVGILLVGVGFSNKEGDTSKESMFAQAGLFLFYNEDARFGIGADPVEGAGITNFSIRIRNEQNHASSWTKLGDEEWKPSIVKDVSGFHHNNYNGFFALRPGYFLRDGAELVNFNYQPL